jgi:hypothetical protein
VFLRVVGALIAFWGMAAFGLAGFFNFSRTLEAVNQRLPHDQQFGWLGWGPVKYFRFKRECRRFDLYRDFRRKDLLLWLGGVACMLAFGWMLSPLFR